MNVGRVAALVLVAALGWTRLAAAAVARDGQPVMGTVLTVTVVADDGDVAQGLASAAIEEARRWDDALTIWRADGELARFNAAAGVPEVPAGSRLSVGLRAMLRLEGETGGAFQPLVAMLGLAGAGAAAPLPRLAGVLRVRGDHASLASGHALDPGAVGKGLALDAIVAMLRSRGVASAFLDFGGSSQSAIGVPPGDAAGWGVLISGWSTATTHGIVKLRDAALSTSRAGAEDTTPVLDPRSGQAVAGPRLATVLGPEAASADAWSTALVVLGRTGLGAASEHGLQGLVEDGGGVQRSTAFPLLP